MGTSSEAVEFKLRDEILESQRASAEMSKWKLVGAAGLFAMGLGLSDGPKHSLIVIAAIPLVCLYVDVACTQHWVRIVIIGSYLRRMGSAFREYEMVVERARARQMYHLENWARLYTTGAILTAVFAIGAWLFRSTDTVKRQTGFTLMALSAAGVLGSVLLRRHMLRIEHKLDGWVRSTSLEDGWFISMPPPALEEEVVLAPVLGETPVSLPQSAGNTVVENEAAPPTTERRT